MSYSILNQNRISTQDLNDKYNFHYKFDPHFEIEWVPVIIDREEAAKWFRDKYDLVLNEPIIADKGIYLNKIENWKEEDWGKWADLRLVILRDCIKIDYNTNTFTTFNQFMINAFMKMGKKYSNSPKMEHVLEYLKNYTNVFNYTKNAKQNFKKESYFREDPFLGNEILFSYLKLAYFGFLKEAYTKLIAISHLDANRRKYDVYQTDEKGDFQNMDFFIYIPRKQKKGLQGIWKTIGVGSKAVKNETHQKVHFMVQHYKDKRNVEDYEKNSEHLGGGLYLLKEKVLDEIIEKNISNL